MNVVKGAVANLGALASGVLGLGKRREMEPKRVLITGAAGATVVLSSF